MLPAPSTPEQARPREGGKDSAHPSIHAVAHLANCGHLRCFQCLSRLSVRIADIAPIRTDRGEVRNKATDAMLDIGYAFLADLFCESGDGFFDLGGKLGVVLPALEGGLVYVGVFGDLGNGEHVLSNELSRLVSLAVPLEFGRIWSHFVLKTKTGVHIRVDFRLNCSDSDGISLEDFD
jgi:hypothetical protein